MATPAANNIDAALYNKLHFYAELISGVCAIGACLISGFHITQHLRYNKEPQLRNYTVRVLLMVPIYATQAWLGLRFIEASFFFTVLRELYEALVLFTFMQFLLAYLGGPGSLSRKLEKRAVVVAHLAPLCKMTPWQPGPHFLRHAMFGTLQYVPVLILCAVVTIVASLAGVLRPGDFGAGSLWMYLVVVKNISQCWALYCLVLFYQATAKELSSINPFVKFMCIKLIVFFTFWQSCAIQLAEHFFKLNDTMSKIVESKAVENQQIIAGYGTGTENFLICIEMLGFAIMHRYAFPHAEFGDYSRDEDDLRPTRRSAPETPLRSKLVKGIDFSDIFEAATDIRSLEAAGRGDGDRSGLIGESGAPAGGEDDDEGAEGGGGGGDGVLAQPNFEGSVQGYGATSAAAKV